MAKGMTKEQRSEPKPPHQWVKESEQGEKVAWLVLYPVKCQVCSVRGNVAQHRVNTGSGRCNGPRKKKRAKENRN